MIDMHLFHQHVRASASLYIWYLNSEKVFNAMYFIPLLEDTISDINILDLMYCLIQSDSNYEYESSLST